MAVILPQSLHHMWTLRISCLLHTDNSLNIIAAITTLYTLWTGEVQASAIETEGSVERGENNLLQSIMMSCQRAAFSSSSSALH